MSYLPIEDYGIIGNLYTIALIGRNGSMDWLCFPHLDSPSVFGALLDDEKGGRFVIQPAGEFDSTSKYIPRTNILVTRFRTRTGIMKLVDFMPVALDEPGENGTVSHVMYRVLEQEEGEMEVIVRCEPRFDYARTETDLRPLGDGFLFEGGNLSLALLGTGQLEARTDRIEGAWRLQAGDKFVLKAGADIGSGENLFSGFTSIDTQTAEQELQKTTDFWQQWLEKNETGRNLSHGPYREMMERSALVLKLLHYGPAGTIAAAATTSLPEDIGGERNWDYRYTWIRDTAFTLDALFNLGHLSEMENYFQWILDLLHTTGPQDLHILYGLRGETVLQEIELNHLDGYKGSRPVRIGNQAAGQKQMDIYGELMDAALKLSEYVGKIKAEHWPGFRKICDHVVDHWREKDSGIWEVRGGLRDFVFSKVMCWVALDRGITIARRYGFEADFQKWEKTRAEIHLEVCERGYNRELQAFVQSYDSPVLDASSLLIPILGFLPFDDPRVLTTVEAIEDRLSNNGLLYRYHGDDGLEGGEGTFLLCSFWLVECLVGMGRLTEAESLISRLGQTANHLGLFSEEYDVEWRQALGNFPQAFTHIGYVKSVTTLLKARREDRCGEKGNRESAPAASISPLRKIMPFSRIILNQGQPEQVIPPAELAATLKARMNLLRGAFFDTLRGRVAYERMKGTDIYREYVEATRSLREFDPGLLENREEKIAFWLNLYNVIVIHGIVESGIRDSVKEVTGFFRRIRYIIGEHAYTPDDIEHGILRANRRPPYSLFRVFGGNDPRLAYSLEEEDPRIHFALVCASSSCPPIDLYTSKEIDRELDQSGRSFLNGGGLIVKTNRKRVSLSRIFKWYGNDFGNDKAALLRRLADYIYDADSRNFLKSNAESLSVDYQEYDWRLNR